jgi:iron complex outermembrane receptor protein
MPMYTEEQQHRRLTLKAEPRISTRAEPAARGRRIYQHYTLDDWWPPSGGGMWPGTFDNINDGTRDRLGAVRRVGGTPNTQWTDPARCPL